MSGLGGGGSICVPVDDEPPGQGRVVRAASRRLTAVPGNTGAVCLAVACRHRRLAFLVNQQDEAARGATREQPNLMSVTVPMRIPAVPQGSLRRPYLPTRLITRNDRP